MDAPAPWRRMVLLRHELPDGSHHFDWMLERDDVSPLTTYRTARRLDALAPSEGAALEPIPDHRRAYLEREGPVSGGRGVVVRVASGTWRELDAAPGGRVVELRWAPENRPTRRRLEPACLQPAVG